MKKYIVLSLIILTGLVQAAPLPTVPSWFGPLSVRSHFLALQGNIQTNYPVWTGIGGTFAKTNTPVYIGQFQVGATNLYVAVGLTTNDWLTIK